MFFFSSYAEEDLANHSASSCHSVLARPLLPSDSSPSAVEASDAAAARRNRRRSNRRHVSFADNDAVLPSPIRASGHYPRGPRRLEDAAVAMAQSTPSGLLRHRGRTTRSGIAAAANGVSPQKRLNFDA